MLACLSLWALTMANFLSVVLMLTLAVGSLPSLEASSICVCVCK